MRKIILGLLSMTLATQVGFASTVRSVEFEGLQRVRAQDASAMSGASEKHPISTQALIENLYRSGAFEQVSVSEKNGHARVSVTEYPVIGRLKYSGNSAVPTDKLKEVFNSLNISEGRIYSPAQIDKITKGLLAQYYELGRYNAKVDTKVSPLSEGRVAVDVQISEGLVAKIDQIHIVGAHALSESQLIKALPISTRSILNFFSEKDRYSENKLADAADKLKSYYMDRGYIRFQLKSYQAQLSADRKSVYVTFAVQEGDVYKIRDVKLSGSFAGYESKLKETQTKYLKPGDIFSKQKLIDMQKDMSKVLGNQGYVFADFSAAPDIHDQDKTVSLNIVVTPGKHVYVRHITYSNNSHTNEIVLRRRTLQVEGAMASSDKIEDSKRRMMGLPYIKNAEVEMKPVEGTDDKVDLNYKVEEQSAAQVSFRVGYSQLYKTLLGFGVEQPNFFGTGNTVGLNVNHTSYMQSYSANYTDPYFTDDGVSRTMSVSYTHYDPRAASVSSGYTANEYAAELLFGIPVGQELGADNRIEVGGGFENTVINLANIQNVSNQIQYFIDKHHRRFQQAYLYLGFDRDSRDRVFMPTKGTYQSISSKFYFPAVSRALSYYTLNYQGKFYQPLTHDFILTGRAELAYGSGFSGAQNFPFFKNFYAGGIDSVRGYEDYNLGPRDSLDHAYGGNEMASASLGIILPNFVSDSLRTTFYFDAGNVWSTLKAQEFAGVAPHSGRLRYSVGIALDIITPLVPIELSLGKAVMAKKGDKREPFQFALGLKV